jgi:hypothetical protein
VESREGLENVCERELRGQRWGGGAGVQPTLLLPNFSDGAATGSSSALPEVSSRRRIEWAVLEPRPRPTPKPCPTLLAAADASMEEWLALCQLRTTSVSLVTMRTRRMLCMEGTSAWGEGTLRAGQVARSPMLLQLNGSPAPV